MKELIINLGTDERGAQTFLKLLELGAQPVSVIARYMNVPRPTMYLMLEELKKIGLVQEFERNQMKYFKCIPVQELENLLEAKEADLKRTRQLYEVNLSDLESLENKLSVTPKVKFYEGEGAVMKVYEEVIKEKSFCAFFNPGVDNKVMQIYFKKVEEAIRAKKMKVKEFVIDCKKGREYFAQANTSNHKVKILPKRVGFDSDTIITDEKIYMFSYGEKEVAAVEIWNKALAETQRAMFEELWGKSS
jgi:sugar-specific transcriptional regulator TrmB